MSKIIRAPFYILLLFVLIPLSCQQDKAGIRSNLTIIFINDQHGQIDNLGKLKQLIEQEKKDGEVIVACSGDMFSGNPVVDIYDPPGFPMIDLMNTIGFDIAVIGNHEFDYGQDVLKARMNQAAFDWVCANVDMTETGIPQPAPYLSLTAGDLKVTFLGLVETNGKMDDNIPSTHPLKVEGIHFERPENVVSDYADIKTAEHADLYIALTHLGHNYSNGYLGDFQLAEQFPYFDLIIGGHSHYVSDTVINEIPVFQAGSYLNYAGVIDIEVKNQQVESIDFEAIDLNQYPETDETIEAKIELYNEGMENALSEVIGYSEIYHSINQLGCFYTEALKERLGTDFCIQNRGGIRTWLDEGDITVRDIYEIDPFNNRAMIYRMTGAEIKNFINGSHSWYSYSGILIEQNEEGIILRYPDGSMIEDDQILSLGINDYIPSVNDVYFPPDGEIQDYTTAEAMIYYLKEMNSNVNYPDCDRNFN